jgi:hypothetical protein
MTSRRATSWARVPESFTMPAILLALRLHPKVAWAERINTGGAWFGERDRRQFVKFGWSGMADLTGQMRDGRRLDVEAKASNGKPTTEQSAYLALVRRFGGVAFVARSVDDVIRELAAA